MLHSIYRFHGHGGLRYVYTRGTAVRSRFLTCKFVEGRRPHPRIAVVISKKTLKSAVGRNRMRRRLFEVIRLELPMIKARNDIVFIITSQELNELTYDNLRGVVRQLLTQADLYKTDKN